MAPDDGKQDRTSQPIPPPLSLLASDILAGAESNTYLGNITEADAHHLVKRNFALTDQTDMVVADIVNDNRFPYESVSAFYRHAIELLTLYYVEHKYILDKYQGFASDILRQQHELRLDAERARIRGEFSDNIKVLDKEMDAARQIGDWEFMGKRLKKYATMLESCESETQRRLLREILAASVATRSAAIAFYRWLNSEFRVPVDNWDDEWGTLAERWFNWYNEFEEDK